MVEVPADVARGVRGLLDRLGLRFAALDFVVRPDGRWVFLECNPNGQWAWLAQALGLPIVAAVGDVLTGES